ncbi:MAG: AAA family ATPase, partial [Lachnospiraceae bacterium]|nr:AAA family ATPase [Lachnospiraceae bacterium]
EICPAVLLVDLPDEEILEGTRRFVDRSPLRASFYDSFLHFLENAAAELPGTSIYVLMFEGCYDPADLEREISCRGVAGLIDVRNRRQIAAEIYGCIERNRMGQIANRFAREKKGLSFTTSPNDENGELAIRLRGFRVETLVSGSDSDALLSDERMPSVTFDDYIGGETVKNEVRAFVSYLKNPGKYRNRGDAQPRGILLYGPPGTGKTFFAKALAHEADVPFFPANGSSFIDQYAGSGPKAIRELFHKARKYAPSIIFIDEIDAIEGRRTGEYRAAEETLNMLLSELDGFDADGGRPVFFVAATNYGIDQNSATALDPELVRRFTKTIYVGEPSWEERREFIRRSVEKYPGALNAAELDGLAARSAGLNYSGLKNIVEAAAREAQNREAAVTAKLLDDALETWLFGEKKVWDAVAMERSAWHEAGHALIYRNAGRTPEYITIEARGNYGGYVMSAEPDEGTVTREALRTQIRASLAGRAAELLRYGEEAGLSVGPAEDFRQAGALISAYVCEYGMDERLGLIYVPDLQHPPEEVRKRINELMNEFLEETIHELEGVKDALQRLADALLRKNRMNAREIEEVLGEAKHV